MQDSKHLEHQESMDCFPDLKQTCQDRIDPVFTCPNWSRLVQIGLYLSELNRKIQIYSNWLKLETGWINYFTTEDFK